MFDKLLKLSKQLYPTGRAFKMPIDGEFEKLTKAIARSEERFYVDSYSILDTILPDNNNFTVDDATDWERRLGMPNGSLNTITDRKAAISRKLNAPGINPAKGHYLNLQRELRAAGFNVFVYENIPAIAASSFAGAASLGGVTTQLQYGQKQYGQFNYGVYYVNKIANNIEEAFDMNFNLGGSYKSSFFIGGDSSNGFVANVPSSRKNEFRELILKIKQVQSIGFLFINYTP